MKSDINRVITMTILYSGTIYYTTKLQHFQGLFDTNSRTFQDLQEANRQPNDLKSNALPLSHSVTSVKIFTTYKYNQLHRSVTSWWTLLCVKTIQL